MAYKDPKSPNGFLITLNLPYRYFKTGTLNYNLEGEHDIEYLGTESLLGFPAKD